MEVSNPNVGSRVDKSVGDNNLLKDVIENYLNHEQWLRSKLNEMLKGNHEWMLQIYDENNVAIAKANA